MTVVVRKTYEIPPEIWSQLMACRGLVTRRDPRKVREVWARFGATHGFDFTTVMAGSAFNSFTALPTGHGKHWCYPYPLTCRCSPPAALDEILA